MLFLGLDLSLTATGFCLIDENAVIIRAGLIIGGKTRGAERLVQIEQRIKGLALGEGELPELVAIEGYSYGSFVGGERLGELGGVIRAMLWKKKIPFVEVPPSTLKKFVSGSGATKKNVMLKAIFKKWNQDFNDDNIGDAYSLARLIWSSRCIASSALAAYEREVIEKIFYPGGLTNVI